MIDELHEADDDHQAHHHRQVVLVQLKEVELEETLQLPVLELLRTKHLRQSAPLHAAVVLRCEVLVVHRLSVRLATSVQHAFLYDARACCSSLRRQGVASVGEAGRRLGCPRRCYTLVALFYDRGHSCWWLADVLDRGNGSRVDTVVEHDFPVTTMSSSFTDAVLALRCLPVTKRKTKQLS